MYTLMTSSFRRLVLMAVMAGCGGTSIQPALDDAGTADAGADAGRCAAAPSGQPFTFHVRNASAAELTLWLGCGRSVPIVLDTPAGALGISPGVDVCEFTCDDVYAGRGSPGACSDCGPGYSAAVAPGTTKDFVWSRSVYEAHMADVACGKGTGTCALGRPLAPSATQSGTLTACGAAIQFGSCADPKTTRFSIDTTASEATIEMR
jgi:hypothetical protein